MSAEGRQKSDAILKQKISELFEKFMQANVKYSLLLLTAQKTKQIIMRKKFNDIFFIFCLCVELKYAMYGGDYTKTREKHFVEERTLKI